MEALIASLVVVGVAEIGDRTQLLSLLLASRFRQPLPILAGILIATIANHLGAGLAGEWLGQILAPSILRWVLVASFVAMAVWALIPDRLDEREPLAGRRHGAFLATLTCFFLAEMGDKTQIATAALAARFNALPGVVAGSTAGMMLANIPVVLFGHFAGHRIDPRWARYAAAAIFLLQAALTLAGYTFI
jgi:putative Ca2+/H+ antiporter (TMEM165/GDT1 family)